MKQIEFDKKMNEMNKAEKLALLPLQQRLADNSRCAMDMQIEKYKINIRLDEIKAENIELEIKMRTIREEFRAKKREFIINNPKDSMEDEEDNVQ